MDNQYYAIKKLNKVEVLSRQEVILSIFEKKKHMLIITFLNLKKKKNQINQRLFIWKKGNS